MTMESFVVCPECSGEVSSASAVCPQCGASTWNAGGRVQTQGGDVLGKLWRGEYSLPVTYWGFGMLGGLAWLLLDGALVASGIGEGARGLVALGMLAYSVVMFVAIWRSAARYAGPKVWASLAQIAVVLGVIRTIAALLGGVE